MYLVDGHTHGAKALVRCSGCVQGKGHFRYGGGGLWLAVRGADQGAPLSAPFCLHCEPGWPAYVNYLPTLGHEPDYDEVIHAAKEVLSQ